MPSDEYVEVVLAPSEVARLKAGGRAFLTWQDGVVVTWQEADNAER